MEAKQSSTLTIRAMCETDAEETLEMMKIFYASPAVLHKASEEILRRDIKDCIGDMPFVEGYILEEAGKTAGYAMVSKSYTTEYGGLCLWVEDIYIKPQYRHRGISGQFFAFLEKKYAGQAVRLKLEVEVENEHAMEAYKKSGLSVSAYKLMTKEL